MIYIYFVMQGTLFVKMYNCQSILTLESFCILLPNLYLYIFGNKKTS